MISVCDKPPALGLGDNWEAAWPVSFDDREGAVAAAGIAEDVLDWSR
jgi:hypothetical protein